MAAPELSWSPAPAARRPAEHRHDAWLPTYVQWMFLGFGAYLVLPVLEVPLFGLSLSAPLFCFLTLELLKSGPRMRWDRYHRWMLFAAVFWTAMFLSLAGNTLLGKITAWNPQDVLMLTRFAYWMLVFLVTAALVSQAELGRKLVETLGLSAVVLGAMRLIEAAAFGYWGSGRSYFLSPNDYGWGFSTFTPFALWLVLASTGWKRWFAVAGVVSLLTAVAVNGSRSSWITVLMGLLLLAALFSYAHQGAAQRLFGPALLLAGMCAGGWALSSLPIFDPVRERASTFETLDRDKPFLARQLLVRKGLRLFEQNPLFGVGAGRFTRSEAPLEIPYRLRYGSESEFNRKSPHNSYIALLAESGLLGVSSFAALLLVLTVGGLRAAVRHARRGQSWALPIYVGFISMSLHFWTLSGLTGTAAWFIYGLVAGLMDREAGSAAAARLAPSIGPWLLRSRGI